MKGKVTYVQTCVDLKSAGPWVSLVTASECACKRLLTRVC